jgi:hypothetical protein
MARISIYGEDLDGHALRRAIGQFSGRADGADVELAWVAAGRTR